MISNCYTQWFTFYIPDEICYFLPHQDVSKKEDNIPMKFGSLIVRVSVKVYL